MELQGTVRNVVDFGAFVDIGVKQDGLVHISKLKKGFVKHPLDVVSLRRYSHSMGRTVRCKQRKNCINNASSRTTSVIVELSSGDSTGQPILNRGELRCRMKNYTNL